jgi:predicted permease
VPLLSGSNWGNNVSVEGFKAGPDTDTNSRFNEVGPGYYAALGIPLLAGRDFTRADALSAPKVAIVNEAFAKKFNLGRDAVGKHVGDGGSGSKLDAVIVGLVQNAKYSEVKREIPPQFFRPYRQDARLGFINFYVRTASEPEAFMASIKKAIATLDPNLPLENLRTLPQQIRDNVFLDRFISVLSTAFACLATLLAALGLYGVLSHAVTQQRREIGIRMALGARSRDVLWHVLRNALTLVMVGLGLGVLGSVALTRVMKSLLFEVSPLDPLALTAACLSMTLIGLFAGLLPASRAARVDPITTLRDEG